MTQQTILIATADDQQRQFIAEHFDADAFTVYDTDSVAGTIAKLSAHAIDVLLLADLQRRAASPALLREIRAAQHPRVHPGQIIITLGATDDVSILRAYDSGSDHHLPADTGYVVLRAVLATILRRTQQQVTSRHLHVGRLHIDTAARTADIAGTPVKTTRIEFDLLCKLASDPTRVFTKQQLMHAVWGYHDSGRSRTLDSHAARLRAQLKAAGADGLIKNIWGTGYALHSGQPGR